MTLWVIKIGTSLIRGTRSESTEQFIESISNSIAIAKGKGDSIIIVTSGAVGIGCSRLGLKTRPPELPSLQAAAAVGQGHLMSLYEKALIKRGYHVAQILLTRLDLGSRLSYKNATLTLTKLLKWGVVPIVNENDSISDEELRYGDNDTLSALVANLIKADQLILLTDIDKLYSDDPKSNKEAKPISDVHNQKELKTLEDLSSNSGTWGTGGIRTKLAAARIATNNGITVHLADGRKPAILNDLLKGSRGGTVFHPNPKPIGSIKSWLAHAIEPVGSIELDEGACEAIQTKGASLLIVGIVSVEGNFESNQPVRIISKAKEEIARGISSISSDYLRNSLKEEIRSTRSQIVVHRDVLVLTSDLLN